MQEEKAQEVSIVIEADTLIDPDTMVIELLHAMIADGAMLGASWFLMHAGPTFHFGLEQDAVKLKSIQSTLLEALIRVL